MQRILQFFNPDSDLALASGDSNYIAPRLAAKMGKDLSVLPCWYSSQDEAVLIADKDRLKKWDSPHPRCDFFDYGEVKGHSELIPMPWGWNPMLVHSFRKMGINGAFLPDDERMECLRRLSHRASSVRLFHSLSFPFPVCGAPEVLSSDETVRIYVENHSSCLLKEPLSGSGKGLRWCRGQYNEMLQRWSRNIIRNQEGIIAEPVYNKVKDFAMEFYVDTSGEVSFAGYSLFMTDEWGAYEGNLLVSDQEIERLLSDFVPLEQLLMVKEQLICRLSQLLQGNYTGYLGIDMMICKSEGSSEYLIHPCVEINLRMNMGMVARKLFDNHVSPQSQGFFRVDYYKTPRELMQRHEMMSRSFPLLMEGDKVKCGYLPLIPICDDTQYLAYINVKEP